VYQGADNLYICMFYGMCGIIPIMNASPKYSKFMEEYTKTSNITQSAIKAGFSKMYADKQGKRILNTALRIHAQGVLDRSKKHEITAKEGKQTMADMLGMSREQVFNRLRNIGEQERDYASALKVLGPLSKELGVDIGSQDAEKITVPILNIGVIKTENSTDVKYGSVEPLKEG
jgi:phage terminase small subunit